MTQIASVPKPQLRDDIELDGGHYFLSKQTNIRTQKKEWAIRREGSWYFLDSGYQFVYLGPDKSKTGTSSWRVMRKQGTPKATTAKTTLTKFIVRAHWNKHMDILEFNARDANHAKLLTLGTLSRKTGLTIPALRTRLLPDAIEITQI